MVVVCAACGAKNDDGLTTLHCRFPQDVRRYNLWVKLIQREDLVEFAPDVCKENYGLCSDHLAPENFYGDKLWDGMELPSPYRNNLGCRTTDAVEEAMDLDTAYLEVDKDVFMAGVAGEAITDDASETDFSATMSRRAITTEQVAYAHVLQIKHRLFRSAEGIASEIEAAAASPALPTTSLPVPSSLTIKEPKRTPSPPQPWRSLSSILREELQAAIDNPDEDYLVNFGLEAEYNSYSDDHRKRKRCS